MNRRIRQIVLLFVLLSLAVNTVSWAAPKGPSPEEIQKMKDAIPNKASAVPTKPRKVLVFNLCRGYWHSAIPYGAKVLEIMGKKTGAFTTVVSEDISMFEPEKLSQFDAVVMNNTTGELFLPSDFDKLSEREKQAAKEYEQKLRTSLLDFVRSGKGIMGIHAGTDCFYNWHEYGRMMGGYFDGHPWHEEVFVKIDDPQHILNAAFSGEEFAIVDEIYQHKSRYSLRVLARVLTSLETVKTDMDKKGIKRDDNDFALSWIKNEGRGRVFYGAFGHRHEIFWNSRIMRHYLDGLQFVLGDLEAETMPTIKLDMGPEDLFMGEYVGNLQLGSKTRQIEADVFTQGKEHYGIRIGDSLLEGIREDEHINISGTLDGTDVSGRIEDAVLALRLKDSTTQAIANLRFNIRRSPTERQAPPVDAVVLLPYEPGKKTDLGEWHNQGWERLPEGSVQVTMGHNLSKRKFGDCKLHVEFQLCHMPYARGQARSNSGIFIHQYEVQVLDSFGLVPEKGDCAAIYSIAPPTKNASLPPHRWQTYDIIYQAPRLNADGSLKKPAIMTVYHNGVLVHDKQVIAKPTATDQFSPDEEGPILLQDHLQPIRFRNIWVQPLDGPFEK